MKLRRDGRARRDALLDAALRCFDEKGVLATGIEDIRREANASPSSVYHQFGDVNALTMALLTRTFERLFHHLATEVAAKRTAKALVTTLTGAHLDWIFANPIEGRFMYQATSLEMSDDASEALQVRKAELLAPVVARFAEFIARNELPRWSPLMFDVVLLGASHEACRRLLAGAALDRAWMRSTLPELAWRSVAPSSTKRVSTADPTRARGANASKPGSRRGSKGDPP